MLFCCEAPEMFYGLRNFPDFPPASRRGDDDRIYLQGWSWYCLQCISHVQVSLLISLSGKTLEPNINVIERPQKKQQTLDCSLLFFVSQNLVSSTTLVKSVVVWPLSADVPETGAPCQDLLPLGVPPQHHPTVLLAQQTLQLRVDSILAGMNKVIYEQTRGQHRKYFKI